MTRLVPELFQHYRVRPVDHYPQLLLAALRAVAPSADGEATVVVWTPGPMQLGLLRARVPRAPDGRRARRGVRPRRARRRPLHAHDATACERVHAVYRRLDDDFIDPLEFRPDSLLGVPGLVRAYRAGTVAIANAFGTGVADDKAIYHYVPEMIRFYLGEEPLLAERARPTCWPTTSQREHVLGAPATSWSSSRPASPAARACSSARRRRATSSTALADVIRAQPEQLDRPGGREPLDRADRGHRRDARAAPRRPAPVRRLRRDDQDRPRRPDARRAGGGLDDRQLLARRRLEGHVGARGRRGHRPRRARRAASRRRPTMPDLRYGGLGRPATAATAAAHARPDRPRAVLARAQPRPRRAHRAHARRRLPGRLQGRPDDPAGVTLGWGSLLAIMGAPPGGAAPRAPRRGPARADARRPTTRRRSSRASRARARARARVRDVISAEMWEAINTTHLDLRGAATSAPRSRRGPYCRLPVRQGALRAVLGPDAAHDAARRGARVPRRRRPHRVRPTWCCGCCASRCRPTAGATSGAESGQALALLQAVGGFQAYRRAVPAPPNALPGRALPALRARLPRLRRGLGRRRAQRARPRRRQPAQLRAGAAPQPPERRPRVPRPRRRPTAATCTPRCEAVQEELARVDRDIAERYFAGARRGTMVVA